MSAAFTPGPWEPIEYPDGQSIEIEGGGCTLAVVEYDDGAWTAEPESRANATLMASAPKLYEVLASLKGLGAESRIRVDAALAKARGEQSL